MISSIFCSSDQLQKNILTFNSITRITREGNMVVEIGLWTLYLLSQSPPIYHLPLFPHPTVALSSVISVKYWNVFTMLVNVLKINGSLHLTLLPYSVTWFLSTQC